MAPTILVVEDHPDTGILIARTLQPQGYSVTLVADGESALAATADQWPDLAIVDVLLPRIDGLRIVRMLRQCDPHLPVIVISAAHHVLEQPNVVFAGLDPHSIAFLAKPFSLTDLLSLVRQQLSRPS